MQIKITPKLPDQDEEQEQTYRTYLVMRMACKIEQEFPWSGDLHTIGVTVQPQHIWLTWLGPLTELQIQWLQDSPCVARWKWRRGGTLSIPNQQVSVHAPTGFLGYETPDGQKASLAIFSSPLPTMLSLDNQSVVVHSNTHLQELLHEAALPLTGWTHRLRLCVRCDQPGATIVTQRCLECDMAYHTFMQPPVEILLQNHVEEGTRQTEWQHLLAERHLPLPDESVPDEDDLDLQEDAEEAGRNATGGLLRLLKYCRTVWYRGTDGTTAYYEHPLTHAPGVVSVIVNGHRVGMLTIDREGEMPSPQVLDLLARYGITLEQGWTCLYQVYGMSINEARKQSSFHAMRHHNGHISVQCIDDRVALIFVNGQQQWSISIPLAHIALAEMGVSMLDGWYPLQQDLLALSVSSVQEMKST